MNRIKCALAILIVSGAASAASDPIAIARAPVVGATRRIAGATKTAHPGRPTASRGMPNLPAGAGAAALARPYPPYLVQSFYAALARTETPDQSAEVKDLSRLCAAIVNQGSGPARAIKSVISAPPRLSESLAVPITASSPSITNDAERARITAAIIGGDTNRACRELANAVGTGLPSGTVGGPVAIDDAGSASAPRKPQTGSIMWTI